MVKFFLKRAISFRHAFAGFAYALRTQPNTWIHVAATIAVLLLAVLLRLPAVHVAVLILTIGAVWTAELVNTAVEALVDLASPDHHPLAKISKDTAAAAVLAAAVAAVLVGLLVLGPPLLKLLQSWIR